MGLSCGAGCLLEGGVYWVFYCITVWVTGFYNFIDDFSALMISKCSKNSTIFQRAPKWGSYFKTTLFCSKNSKWLPKGNVFENGAHLVGTLCHNGTVLVHFY